MTRCRYREPAWLECRRLQQRPKGRPSEAQRSPQRNTLPFGNAISRRCNTQHIAERAILHGKPPCRDGYPQTTREESVLLKVSVRARYDEPRFIRPTDPCRRLHWRASAPRMRPQCGLRSACSSQQMVNIQHVAFPAVPLKALSCLDASFAARNWSGGGGASHGWVWFRRQSC